MKLYIYTNKEKYRKSNQDVILVDNGVFDYTNKMLESTGAIKQF